MNHIVITGGSRGIGKALAHEFLHQGCRVSLTSRKRETVEATVAELVASTGNKACHGFVCDVVRMVDIQKLWETSSSIQEVHIWINNAGINHINHQFHKLDPDVIGGVTDINIRGTMFASKVALEGMIKQGFGFLYNMEGFGSDGRIMEGMSIYGTSKNAIRYFTRSLIKEYQNTKVNIGTISPGMVVTDMLLEPLRLEPEKNSKALKVFHILADPPEKVTPWLVSRILVNKKHGAHIAWLSKGKVMRRFFSSMFKKRKVKGLPDF
jgi:short-subunit dehydrogenase